MNIIRYKKVKLGCFLLLFIFSKIAYATTYPEYTLSELVSESNIIVAAKFEKYLGTIAYSLNGSQLCGMRFHKQNLIKGILVNKFIVTYHCDAIAIYHESEALYHLLFLSIEDDHLYLMSGPFTAAFMLDKDFIWTAGIVGEGEQQTVRGFIEKINDLLSSTKN